MQILQEQISVLAVVKRLRLVPALQAELALQDTEELLFGYLKILL